MKSLAKVIQQCRSGRGELEPDYEAAYWRAWQEALDIVLNFKSPGNVEFTKIPASKEKAGRN